MANSREVVDAREATQALFAEAIDAKNENISLDSIIKIGYAKEENNTKETLKMDAIIAGDSVADEDKLDSYTLTMDMINNFGEGNSPDNIIASISASRAIAKTSMIYMDGIDSLKGGEVLAGFALLNQYVILNSDIDGLSGNIIDFDTQGGTSGGEKHRVYSLDPMVIKGKGVIGDNTLINPQNALVNIATLSRDYTFEADGTATTFTANVKIKDEASEDNYAIRRGRTSILIGDDYEVNDYDVESDADVYEFPRVIKKSGEKVNVKITYGTGVIEIKLDSAATLEVGTPIVIDTHLNDEKLSDTRSQIGTKVGHKDYVATTVDISTKVQLIQDRKMNRQLGRTMLPMGLKNAGDIIGSGLLGKKIRIAENLAKPFGTSIDLTTNTGLATTSEAFKRLSVAIDSAAVQINVETTLGDEVIVIGGKDMVDAYNMLAKNTDGLNVRDSNNATGVKFIGYIDGKFKAYFDPSYDTRNPKVNSFGAVDENPAKNVYSKLLIVGTPDDVAKRIVISGITTPIIPVRIGINKDTEQEVILQGEVICQANKNHKSRKLAKTILYRTN